MKTFARYLNTASFVSHEAPNDQGHVVVTPYDGTAAADHAKALAAKAGELGATLETIFGAKTELSGGPLRVLSKLRAIYGEELETFPKPGAKEGNNRDEISVDVVIDGTSKSVKTTFYKVFTENTPSGKIIADRLAMCERAKKADTVKDGIPEDIMEMARTRTIDREIVALGKKLGTFRASVKKAMELMYQFIAVSEVDRVVAEPIWEGEAGGDIIQAIDCIHVHEDVETVKDGKTFVQVKFSRDYSVSSFLKLDAAKAIENGGGFKALEATAARGTKGVQTASTAADKLTIKTVETGMTVLAEFHRWLDEISLDRDQAEMGKLLKHIHAKGSDELISAIVESRNVLNDIIEGAKLEAKYTKLQQRAA